MAIIGIFTKQENGSFIGTLETLTVKARLTFEPLTKSTDLQPNFRIASGLSDCGAAWDRSGKQGRYLSVSIDDPTFEAPIHCRLVKTSFENGFNLIWDRPKRTKDS